MKPSLQQILESYLVETEPEHNRLRQPVHGCLCDDCLEHSYSNPRMYRTKLRREESY